MTAAIYCPSNIANRVEKISQTEMEMLLMRKLDIVKFGKKQTNKNRKQIWEIQNGVEMAVGKQYY